MKFTADTYGVVNFNSIKVQLELSAVIQYDVYSNFNSIKVQLEQHLLDLNIQQNEISIP